MSPEVPQIRDASRRLVRELGFLDGGEQTLGIPHAQCHALLEIERAGACTVSELSEVLNLDKSSVSRTAQRLITSRLAKVRADADGRKKRLVLTPAGKKRLAQIHTTADDRVVGALSTLTGDEREAVVRGLALYAKALRRARLSNEIAIRPIEKLDDPDIAALIRTVMPEFGADGPGFAIHDPEVDRMSAAYEGSRAGYWVVERGGRILGGAGFAPLTGGPRDTCELRKMYFYPEARGLGVGSRLIDVILERAADAGFSRCYLETLERMHDARRLYEKKGFAPVAKPIGHTGHFGCDNFYVRALARPKAGRRAPLRSPADAPSDRRAPPRRGRRR